MNEKLIETFRLRISDYNCFDKLMPHAILDLFQDVAGKHADIIGVGFDDLKKSNLIWVLVRTKFEIVRNPKLYEVVNVSTWPKKKGKIDFDREYLIEDNKGEVLVKGISKWVIVNSLTRRICFARDINYNCDISPEENFSGNFDKLKDFDSDGSECYEAQTSYCDLDHNKHVNNISYAKMIMNAIQLDENEDIHFFEINYLKELPKNTKINLYLKKDGKIILVKGIINGEVSFIAKIELY